MQGLSFFSSPIVTVSLGLCAFLAAVGAMMLARRVLFATAESIRHILELRFMYATLKLADQLQHKIACYQEKADILAKYTNDYATVFNEANWTKTVLSLEDLERAFGDVSALIDRGDYKDALCLTEFLCSQGKEIAAWKYERVSDEWDHLHNWESELHQTVCSVADNLVESSEKTKKLGIQRDYSKELSITDLDKVRDKP